MKNLLFLFCFLLSLSVNAQSKISFTFDDGSMSDRPGYPAEVWNAMLLDHLDKAGVKVVFFVSGADKFTEKGREFLQGWNDRGHRIGNHTVNHPNYNRETVSFEDYRRELLQNDSLIRQYSNYIPLFRFPYLKEGNTEEKINRFRSLMKENGYQNGYVTIEASDWYIDSRLVKRLRENPDADLEGFKQYYLQHLYERALYYDQLAYEITGRRVPHTLLLHHNLAAALFIDDLIAMFKAKGWEIVPAEEAFEDEIYEQVPAKAGENLFWAIAKGMKKYEGKLRYPAEAAKYEKEKMDRLGL